MGTPSPPARHRRLGPASPTSHRLRRLAPSPVKVPSRPPSRVNISSVARRILDFEVQTEHVDSPSGPGGQYLDTSPVPRFSDPFIYDSVPVRNDTLRARQTHHDPHEDSDKGRGSISNSPRWVGEARSASARPSEALIWSIPLFLDSGSSTRTESFDRACEDQQDTYAVGDYDRRRGSWSFAHGGEGGCFGEDGKSGSGDDNEGRVAADVPGSPGDAAYAHPSLPLLPRPLQSDTTGSSGHKNHHQRGYHPSHPFTTPITPQTSRLDDLLTERQSEKSIHHGSIGESHPPSNTRPTRSIKDGRQSPDEQLGGPSHLLISFTTPSIGSGLVEKMPGPSLTLRPMAYEELRPIKTGDRDLSVAGSSHTFGPGPSQDRRPSCASTVESHHSAWSYSLSAYGEDTDDDDILRRLPPSRQLSDESFFADSPSSLLIPDFVPFIPPNGTYRPPEPSVDDHSQSHRTPSRSDSPDSFQASELFTPNYSVATHPRPSLASSGGYDYSGSKAHGSPMRRFDSLVPPFELQVQVFKRPGEGLQLDHMDGLPSPKTRVRSDTIRPDQYPSRKPAVRAQPRPNTSGSPRRHEPPETVSVSESQHAQVEWSVPSQRLSPTMLYPARREDRPMSFIAPSSSSLLRADTISDMSRSQSSSFGSDYDDLSDITDALGSFDRSTSITLTVDQEGSREVQTRLRFMKVHKPHVFRKKQAKAKAEAARWGESPGDPELFQETGCVEFGIEPKLRPVWTYHHAPLERCPILRRVTMNDEVGVDYLARGGSMQIRESGVYSIVGRENDGLIEWKFEYMVQTKESTNGGEDGPERLVTPLGFYVSPDFLHPTRGVRIGILSLFQKAMKPKVAAVKNPPPHIGKPPQPSDLPLKTTRSNGSSGSSLTSALTKIRGGTRSATTTPVESHAFGSHLGDPDRHESKPRPVIPHQLSSASESAIVDGNVDPTVQAARRPRSSSSSLFGRSRPFTPPASTVKTDPLPIAAKPKLRGMKSMSSLMKRPHTAQPMVREEVPPVPTIPKSAFKPIVVGQISQPFDVRILRSHSPPKAAASQRPKTSTSPNSASTTRLAHHPFATHIKPLPPLPPQSPARSLVPDRRPHTADDPGSQWATRKPLGADPRFVNQLSGPFTPKTGRKLVEGTAAVMAQRDLSSWSKMSISSSEYEEPVQMGKAWISPPPPLRPALKRPATAR